MLRKIFYGMPRKCENRNCRCAFNKGSHLGWMPHRGLDAYAILRCPKCKDVFKFVQPYAAVHDYFNSLPGDKSKVGGLQPITIQEIGKFRSALDDPKALTKLFTGKKPGAIANPIHEEK